MQEDKFNPDDIEHWILGQMPPDEEEQFAHRIRQDPGLAEKVARCRDALMAVRLHSEQVMREKIKEWRENAAKPAPMPIKITGWICVIFMSILWSGGRSGNSRIEHDIWHYHPPVDTMNQPVQAQASTVKKPKRTRTVTLAHPVPAKQYESGMYVVKSGLQKDSSVYLKLIRQAEIQNILMEFIPGETSNDEQVAVTTDPENCIGSVF